jgi:mannosyltransferase
MEQLHLKSYRFRRTVILVGIMVLAFGVRIIDIGRESLWLDEGVSAMQAFKENSSQIWRSTAHGDLNPPLYYCLLHYWIKLAGRQEGSMRLLSAIFSVLSVWLTYRVGKEVLCRPAAIFAALLTALSLYHLRYAQELRAYALFGFTSLLSALFLLRLCRRFGPVDAVGYILATAIMLYSHPYAVFQWFSQNLFFLLGWLFYRGFIHIRWRTWILLQGLVCLLFSPWLWNMYFMVRKVEKNVPIQWIPRWVDLPGVFKTFAGHNDVGGLLLIILILISVLSAWGIFGRQKTSGENISFHKPSWQNLYLWLWLVCPILLPYLMSKCSASIFHNRYMVAASFACYLLAAAGMMKIRPVFLKGIAAAAIIALFLFTLIPSYFQTYKEQWRDAAAYIEQRANPGDLLLFNSGYTRTCVYWYYAKRQDLAMEGFPVKGDPRVITEEIVRQQVPPLIEGHGRVWLIRSHSFDQDGIVLRYLTEQYDIRDQKEFIRIELYCLENKTSSP